MWLDNRRQIPDSTVKDYQHARLIAFQGSHWVKDSVYIPERQLLSVLPTLKGRTPRMDDQPALGNRTRAWWSRYTPLKVQLTGEPTELRWQPAAVISVILYRPYRNGKRYRAATWLFLFSTARKLRCRVTKPLWPLFSTDHWNLLQVCSI
jgi:hypothetical protein